ncbi:unnamed protein product [Brassica oleracea var. botrytis]
MTAATRLVCWLSRISKFLTQLRAQTATNRRPKGRPQDNPDSSCLAGAPEEPKTTLNPTIRWRNPIDLEAPSREANRAENNEGKRWRWTQREIVWYSRSTRWRRRG